MRFHTLLLVTLLSCLGGLKAADQKQFSDRDPVYRLQPSDTIEISYRYTPEYNSTVTVQPDGYVSLQIAGQVRVSGLTAAETAKAIEGKAASQLNKPEVTVLIKEFVHPYFVVAGEVAHPGRFEMHGPMNAIEAVAISGGFTESSKHSQVVLVRKFNSEYAQVTVLNIKKMMKPSGIDENPEIMPGDMLVVPQNTVSKLERYVRWTSSSLYGIAVLK